MLPLFAFAPVGEADVGSRIFSLALPWVVVTTGWGTAGLGVAPAFATPRFVDIAEEAGVLFEHQTGFDGSYWFPEIVGPGAGLLDFDLDGDLDVLMVNGGALSTAAEVVAPHALYRQEAAGGFREAAPLPAPQQPSYGQGCAVGDVDADGWPDILVTTVGANQLLRNQRDGTFADWTSRSGLVDEGWSTSASFGDVTGDGHLDLYVANYCLWTPAAQLPCRSAKGEPDYCKPQAYEAAPDHFYVNAGDGTFVDQSGAAGIHAAYGRGLGVVIEDLNGDGRRDIYVANDGDPNNLWLNQGDGTFVDDGALSGAALNAVGNAEASMGIGVGDLDGDHDWDLFLSHLTGETNTLYLNGGQGLFEDDTESLALGAASMPFTGFGTQLFDADLDGDLDAFVANGAVVKDADSGRGDWPYAQRNQFFEWRDGGFVERQPDRGSWLSEERVSRGAAFGDIDGDGDIDVLVANAGARPNLLRNEHRSAASWWVGFRLESDGANPFGIGAGVWLAWGAGQVSARQRIARDGSFASASEPRAVFAGARGQEPAQVHVQWPDGSREVWAIEAVDLDRTLRRGTGTPTAEAGVGAGSRAAPDRGGQAVADPVVQDELPDGLPALPALDGVDPAVAERARAAHRRLAEAPGSAAAWKAYGLALYADVEDVEAAGRALAKAHALDAADPRTSYLLALTRQAAGDTPGYRRLLEHTVMLEPYPPARLRLAALAADLEDFDAAEAIYRELTQEDSDDAWAALGLGRVLRRRGKAAIAADQLRLAVDLAPRAREARHELGLALRDLGDLEAARGELLAAQELPASEPPDPWLHELFEGRRGDAALLSSANHMRLAGEFSRAYELYGQYVLRRGDDPVGWANLAAVARDLGLADQALQAADQTLRLDPERAETLALRGVLKAARGDSEPALLDFDRALELNPSLAPAWKDRGVILTETGNAAGAKRSFERYLTLNPKDADGWLRLAEVHLATAALDSARTALERALALQPGLARARFRAGGLALKESRPDDAATHFRGAVAARPDWAEAHMGLAMALKAGGARSEAIAALEDAARLKPEHRRIQTMLRAWRAESAASGQDP